MKLDWTDLTKHPEKISIEFLWKVYSGEIFRGREVSKLQYDEMRKSFYCGFTECFKLMSDFASNLPEDQACDLFSALAKEGGDFVDKLMREHPFAKT